MKTILLSLILLSSLTAPAKADDDNWLSFHPDFNVSGGIQTGPIGTYQGVFAFTAFLIKDSQLDTANLLGVGLGVDTDAKAYIVFSPMAFVDGHLSVQPSVNFGVSNGEFQNRLALSVGYNF
jgi:opacity protein-like surface antigen